MCLPSMSDGHPLLTQQEKKITSTSGFMDPFMMPLAAALFLLLGIHYSAGFFADVNVSKLSEDLQKMFFTRKMYLLYDDKIDVRRKVELVNLQKEFLNPTAILPLAECSKAGWHSLLILPWTTPDALSVLQKMSQKIEMSRWKWLLLTNEDIPQHIFQAIKIPLNCEFAIAIWKEKSLTFSEMHHQGEFRQNILASWSSGAGLKLLTENAWFLRRQNLENFVISAAVEPDNVSIVLKDASPENEPEIIGGYFGAVWKILEQKLRFRTKLKRAPDGAWGAETLNGSWNGMVGMVLRNEADVAITSFTMSTARLDAVSFMAPFWKDGLVVFIRSPDAFYRSWFQLLMPFNSTLWIGVMCALMVLTAALSITSHFWNNDLNGNSHSSRYPPHYAFFVLLASLCQQSQDPPIPWPSRIVYVASYMMAVVLLAAYSGTFVSFLAVRYTWLPFTTFQDLLQDGTYRLGVLDQSAELDHFQETNDSLLQEIYRRLIAPEEQYLPKTHKEGLERLCTRPRYAFLGPYSIILNYANSLSCSIARIPRAAIPATSAMIIKKNSPYLRLINHNVMELQRAGLLSRILAQTTPRLPTASEDPRQVHSVAVEDIVLMIVLLGIGIVVSLLFLLLEITLDHLTKRRRIQISKSC